MTTLPKPAKGEIWLAYLEFSDKPSVGKVRPVLVLENNKEQPIVVVAKVTSVASGVDNSRIELRNWKNYGLLKPSFVRIDQCFGVSITKILRDKPLGKLEDTMFENIATKIKDRIHN